MRGATLAITVLCTLPGCLKDAPAAAAATVRRANPLGSASAPTEAEASFSGIVTAKLKAGGYSYLAIDRGDGGHAWVATMGAGAGVGQRVSVEGFAAKNDFHSRRLDRRFDRIIFAVVDDDA